MLCSLLMTAAVPAATSGTLGMRTSRVVQGPIQVIESPESNKHVLKVAYLAKLVAAEA